MELVKVNHLEKGLMTSGWISVISGIVTLFIINIGILTNYETALDDMYPMMIIISIIFGVIALFSKRSRSLGFWGMSIGLFMIFFTAVIFFLGWAIAPFP